MVITIIGTNNKSFHGVYNNIVNTINNLAGKTKASGITIHTPISQKDQSALELQERIKHIEEADLVIVVPKNMHYKVDTSVKTDFDYNLVFGESTVVQMDMARLLNKPVFIWGTIRVIPARKETGFKPNKERNDKENASKKKSGERKNRTHNRGINESTEKGCSNK